MYSGQPKRPPLSPQRLTRQIVPFNTLTEVTVNRSISIRAAAVITASLLWIGLLLPGCKETPVKVPAPVEAPAADSAAPVVKGTQIPIQPTPDSAARTARRLDSLRKIVDRGVSYDFSERGKNAFMNAAYALGDYYTQRYLAGSEPDMRRAFSYFEKFIYLSNGTDSDLGDDNSMYTRNRLCKRVAALYNKGLLKMRTLRSIYVGHYIDARNLDLGQQDWGGFDSIGTIDIAFVPGNNTLSRDARRMLSNLVVWLRDRPQARILISGGDCDKLYATQISWDQALAVVNYMRDRFPYRRAQFGMSYCEGPVNYVRIRQADSGEVLTPDVAPPVPGMWLFDEWRTSP